MNDRLEALALDEYAPSRALDAPVVRHFRQIVLWPLQVVCETGKPRSEGYDAIVAKLAPGVWRMVEDEFGDEAEFQERHYREFVSFLPHVQRFLYGDAAALQASWRSTRRRCAFTGATMSPACA